MPELPEVETVRRAISPHVEGRTIARAVIRVPSLRWPIPVELPDLLEGRKILSVERRAKYLLLHSDGGTLLLHLGMTGHLRLVAAGAKPQKHDHVDLEFTDGTSLRLNDARRFGAVIWTASAKDHPLLASLGPEPLGLELGGNYLHQRARGRRVAVKAFIMDQGVVVGVGNIYASEALYRAGIHPATPAGRIGPERFRSLAESIRSVLEAAIAAGGTTIRDFADPEGKLGYFRLQLEVYGREGEPCCTCGRPIRALRLAGRSTFYCVKCQR